jgi:hypothetical protein
MRYRGPEAPCKSTLQPALDAEGIRAALRCGRPGCPCRRPRGPVHCPAHADDRPSLAVDERDGRVLVRCHAGCPQDRVLEELRRRGLWPDPRESTGVTLHDLCSAKRLPREFLEDLGVREVRVGGRPAVVVPYFDADGHEVAVRLRIGLQGDRFRWRTGSKPTLYGLWRLQEVRESGWVFLVEGESDAWTCWLHGIPALGVPGKSTWRTELAQHLAGLDVILWCEPDALDLVERVARDVPDLRVIEAPAGTKDLSEAHVRGEDVRALVDRLTHEAEPAEVFFERKREEERRRRAAEALPLARQVLEAPDLWERIRSALRATGIAGDLRPAELLYLAITSRLLDRPVNVALEGPSAAGKTWIASCVLQLFPADAVHRRAAMSERALVYSDADFRHRFLLVGEASGLHHDGVGATLLRTVAWEGRVVYETVEKTAAGLRARLVEKDGPTGVITTTTKALDEELATRFLIVPVPDDARQTEEVLRATAARFANSAAGADLRPFVEAQRWLELAGARQVTVPYAEALARLVDRSAVRVRRDFSQLLTLVAACALLHQLQRPRRGGAVVATLDDYRLVYELTGDLFGAAASLSNAQREAVEAVRVLSGQNEGPVTFEEVARHLGLDRASVRRRLARPLREGYVVNEEPHRNRPARLRPGDRVPEARRALPTPEELAAALGPDGPSGGPEDCRVGEHLDADASHPEGPGEAQEISGGYPPKPLHAMHASRKPAQEANSGVQCPTARQLHASTPARHPPDPGPPPSGPPGPDDLDLALAEYRAHVDACERCSWTEGPRCEEGHRLRRAYHAVQQQTLRTGTLTHLTPSSAPPGPGWTLPDLDPGWFLDDPDPGDLEAEPPDWPWAWPEGGPAEVLV